MVGERLLRPLRSPLKLPSFRLKHFLSFDIACEPVHMEVQVFSNTIRTEGYFNGLLNSGVNHVPNITSYMAFGIEKYCDGRVKISLKQYMDSAKWNGIYGNGDVHPDAPPHDHFIKMYTQQPLARKVERRYLASHERLTATYPLGE